ncbi:DUF1810 family protein [Legionella sp. WA2024007413]
MSNIQRFIKAQQGQGRDISFQQAYAELEAGSKKSHWIWYIFPQLKQLGFSPIAQHFGIADLKEACDYLQNELLFRNYYAMAQLVEQQLKKQIPIVFLMQGEIDTLKLVSSITLFREAASFLSRQGNTPQNFDDLISCCDQILNETSKQGYIACKRTLSFVQDQKNHHH